MNRRSSEPEAHFGAVIERRYIDRLRHPTTSDGYAAVEADFLAEYASLLKRALWMKQKVLPDHVLDMRGHQLAWLSYLYSAAAPSILQGDAWPESFERTLLIGAHFPRWPEIALLLMTRGVLCFLPDHLPWLPKSVHSSIMTFRTGAIGVSSLRHKLRAGIPLSIMVDHRYPNISTLPVTLLGRKAELPLGLLKLVRSAGYRVVAVFPDEQGVRLQELEANPQSVADALGFEIANRPLEWLQWVSADKVFSDIF